MKEYVVSLNDYDDLDGFYEDMETAGGSITIPNRRIECALRRSISRNTHYLLTEEESQLVRQDPRVLNVELLPSERGLEPTLFWNQTGNFEKSAIIDSNDKNWGLLRCTAGVQTSGWGDAGGAFTVQNGQTIYTTSSARNVDVVIVDAHINPDHPEFAYNTDGTGGSRVRQIDWYQYGEYTGANLPGEYSYSTVSSNHGTHVAATVAGNTQGWARDAEIYNIEFAYAQTPVSDWALILFDILRSFHKSKPPNEMTGRRNPTITNHSWGYSLNYEPPLSEISSVTYRGSVTNLTGLSDVDKRTELESNGVPVPLGNKLYRIPARVTALDLDIADAINDGIIVVGAAGNSFWSCTSDASDADYDNTFTYQQAGQFSQIVYHSRGSSPGAGATCINVGNIGSGHIEKKSPSSNWGPRVNVWAPGTNIISAVYDSGAASEFGITLANDPRDTAYKLGSISGTSMASPQVCGLLACLAEQEPNITQSEAMQYVTTRSVKLGQLFNQQPSSPETIVSTVTIANIDGGNRYLINGVDRPTLNFVRGGTYIFDQSDSSNNTHPLRFSITSNGTHGSGGSSLTYAVTALGSTNYSFSGSASGSDPTLNVTEGDVLTFNVSVGGHPFWIKTAASTGTGSGVTTGTITGNGSETGAVVWNTAGVTPGTYYYICQYHGSMVGTINVAAAVGGGVEYTNGVTVVGTPGQPEATTTITVDSNAPSTLYYYCVQHPGMGGSVSITSLSSDWADSGSKMPSQNPYDSLSNVDNNKFLFYVRERSLTGVTTPKVNYKRRPLTGSVYPRPRRSF